MRAKLVESLDDYYFSNNNIEYGLYDKLENIYHIISNVKNNPQYIKAQQELFKLLNFVGLNKLKDLSINDINNLNDDKLFILKNGLNNIIEDYNIYGVLTNESYEPKDLKRIKDFAKKSNGNLEKEINLANQMAKTLTNVDKAIGRAEAAAEIYGPEHEITQIFYDKAKKLGYEGQVPGERLKSGILLGSKLPLEQRYKNPDKNIKSKYVPNKRYGRPLGNPILPIGKVNIRSGECEYFNVYNTWEGDDTVVEVWRDNMGMNTKVLDYNERIEPTTGIASILKPKSQEEIDINKRKYFKYSIIFTSGNEPMHEIGEICDFAHDQNWRHLGRWEMVDYVLLKHMKELILPYGSTISGYVYK